jgi:prophage maintenance system killer protein
MELFLVDNGAVLGTTDQESLIAMLAVAAGGMSEDDFADWIRANLA